VVDADQDNANHNCVSECPPNHGRLKGELEPRFHEVVTVAIGATEDKVSDGRIDRIRWLAISHWRA
jgi:hypothetical protein